MAGAGGAGALKAERSKVVVCDNGTGFVKCGFAGDNFPRATFPCMVGRPMLRYDEEDGQTPLSDLMIGDAAAENRHSLDITYPVSNGIVQNWEVRRPRPAARPRGPRPPAGAP